MHFVESFQSFQSFKSFKKFKPLKNAPRISNRHSVKI